MKYKSVTTSPSGVRTEVEAEYISPAFGSKQIDSADFGTGVLKGARSEQSSIVDTIDAAYQRGLATGLKAAVP